MSPEFLKSYADRGLSCSESTKAHHWETWLAAVDWLLSSQGPVTILTVYDVAAVMPEVKGE